MQSHKHCSECERLHPVRVVVCPCGEILETGHYLRWVAISGVAALGSVVALRAVGWLARISVVEMLMMLPAFLMVLYPAAKLVQRRRDPGRLIWREMGSVYTGRFDRLLIVGAIVVIALMWLGAVPTRHSGMVHPDYAPIRLGWILATMLGWGVATVAMIVDQGVAFFDLRIANTYAKRYRRPTRRTGP